MSAAPLHTSERASELRQAFDRSFVEARHVDETVTDDFIAVHVGGNPYLLRLAEIVGVHTGKKVIAVPSPIRELRGISGFRGAMVPVYDLAMLLGYPRSSSAPWMAMAAAAPLALAFETFDGHFRFPREAMASRPDSESQVYVRGIIRADGRAYSVIHLPAAVAAIKERVRQTAPNEER